MTGIFLRHGTRFDWPNCPLLGLADDESLERFASTFELALDEIAAAR